MHASPLSRRLTRTTFALASAVSAVAMFPCRSDATLTINSWTNNSGDYQYGTAANWTGGVPTSSDQATVYNGFVGLNENPPSVGALLLADVGTAAAMETYGYRLVVIGNAALAGGGLEADGVPAGQFSVQAGSMTITGGGSLGMLSTTSHVHISTTSGTANGALTVDGTSYVDVCGVLDTGTFTNNGDLVGVIGNSTVNATTFTLMGTATQPAAIMGNGRAITLDATTLELHDPNSNLDLSVANSTVNLNGNIDYTPGYIGANITVGDTSNLSFGGGEAAIGYYVKSGSHFIAEGNVNLNGGPTLARAATISSYAAFFTNVNVTGYASLPAAEFDGGSTVTVASGGSLYLSSPYFRGGTSSNSITLAGAGTFEMNGNTQIGFGGPAPYTTVNVNAGTLFDWDGTTENSSSCSITNGELDIYTASIDTQFYFHGVPIGNYGYSGTINVTGGAKLNVAGTAWTLFGSMNLGAGAIVQGQTLTLDGSSSPTGTYALYPAGNAGTYADIQAPLVVDPNATIYMNPGGGLQIDGGTTWAGGQVLSYPYISGTQPYGYLIQNGNAVVTANTTIFCDVLDMDGTANTATWTVNAGVTLTLQPYSLDSLNSTTNAFHSTLNIDGGTVIAQTNLGSWTLAGGTINMNQGGLYFPYIEHDELILGSGSAVGTINVGPDTFANITAPLQSAATNVAGGNVLNVSAGSYLFLKNFGSNAGAVLTKTGGGTVAISGVQNHAGGSQIVVTQGQLNIDTDAGAGGANLALNTSGGTTVLGFTQHLASLTVGGNSLVQLAPGSPSPLVLVTALAMTGGTLDLTDSDAIIHNGNLALIDPSLQIGYANGSWAGVGGIISSYAAADAAHLHALGAILNKGTGNQPIHPVFENQTSVTTDVLIKYTWYGDANLDGVVDGSDYSLIDAGYASNRPGFTGTVLTGWFNGDFNYDGIIDGSDYALIDNAFNNQGLKIAAIVATSTGQIASAPTAVPEPATALLLTALAPACIGRRRAARERIGATPA